MNATYKVLDIFGNEEDILITKKNNKPNLFKDYDAFLDKFQNKKTTDDCYTPKEIIDIIINYVHEKYPLDGRKIIRPFFPGGDFENVDYDENCVVIDNPPFSIISKICKFYIERNIKFFLFSPHMTAFSSDIDCTHIIVSADITYENGATVKTSFISNLFGDTKIIGDAELHKKFKDIQERNKANLPQYQYPDNIITVSKIAYCVEKGVSVQIQKNNVKHYKALDMQKKHGKAIFGAGFIVSNQSAEAVISATAEAESEAEAAKKNKNKFVWLLSEREKEIIKKLSNSKL